MRRMLSNIIIMSLIRSALFFSIIIYLNQIISFEIGNILQNIWVLSYQYNWVLNISLFNFLIFAIVFWISPQMRYIFATYVAGLKNENRDQANFQKEKLGFRSTFIMKIVMAVWIGSIVYFTVLARDILYFAINIGGKWDGIEFPSVILMSFFGFYLWEAATDGFGVPGSPTKQ